MTPRIRRPLVSWLLTIVSGGVYLLFWVWNIANELNSAERTTVLNVNLWRKMFMTLLFLSFLGFIWLLRTSNPILFIMCGVLVFGLCIHVQLTIGRYIQTKDVELGTGASFSNALSITLLWLEQISGLHTCRTG